MKYRITSELFWLPTDLGGFSFKEGEEVTILDFSFDGESCFAVDHDPEGASSHYIEPTVCYPFRSMGSWKPVTEKTQ